MINSYNINSTDLETLFFPLTNLAQDKMNILKSTVGCVNPWGRNPSIVVHMTFLQPIHGFMDRKLSMVAFMAPTFSPAVTSCSRWEVPMHS